MLPAAEYMRPDGPLNLISYMRPDDKPPDVGPKLYIATGRSAPQQPTRSVSAS